LKTVRTQTRKSLASASSTKKSQARPKKAKFAGDNTKVYTMKYIDGEWMSKETDSQPAFVGSVGEDLDEAQEEPPKKKKTGKGKAGITKGK
jgi:hypothetical protein